MGKVNEATAALTALLDHSPTDAEGWAELADLYLTQGLYSQAIYSLEEVLVLAPNAWNVRTPLPSQVHHYFTAPRTMRDNGGRFIACSTGLTWLHTDACQAGRSPPDGGIYCE